jgi:DNA repair protein RecN (Recombination protein N)
MLTALAIRDLLLVDRLDLAFRPGLNVLTGETGAGKSILLDCLGFVLGWRGRADLVRQGAERGEVEAVFSLPADHSARAVLAEVGVEMEAELVLRREARPDGRRQAWANDRRVAAETLRALGETLVELHGQHDDRGLLNPRGHRAILDAFAGAEGPLAEVRAAWEGLAAARRAAEAADARLAALVREEDYLRHAVAELDALGPEPGEEAALDARRRALQAGARLAGELARAQTALAEEGAGRPMLEALRALERAAPAVEGRLDAALEALGRALDALAEAERGVETCLEGLAGDPGELERVEDRLFALRALARKHGVAPDDLGGYASDLRDRLSALDRGATDRAALTRGVETAAASHRAACARLSSLRMAAAGQLDAAVAAELAPLRMERAAFRTVLAAVEPGPDGAESVTFQVATNPGAPPGALNRIASGGELSRFLLALKVCLSDGGQVMIFDEIDRGVGGATADAVGRRLARLAQGGQVLVVTHSPQVAALGGHHFRVEKRIVAGPEGDVTRSLVTALAPDGRIDEIARMLAGDTITAAAREAARALIEGQVPIGTGPRRRMSP